jgi:hypothetical protein
MHKIRGEICVKSIDITCNLELTYVSLAYWYSARLGIQSYWYVLFIFLQE